MSRMAWDGRSGMATFVLGDVVGSTRQWADRGGQMSGALAALDALVDRATAEHNGERPIEQGEGDSFVVTFASASDGCAFAIDLQSGLRVADGLDVRMAIHTGEAERRDDGRWLGPTLNRCARLRALAAGGQVLVSGATAELVIDALPFGASLRDLGKHRLRDLANPEHVRQLCHADLVADFPPLRSVDRLPNNLPLQLSSFVGRDDALADISRLMDQHRLVTLTGAGGAGKTRLAVHVAADRLDQFPDGVWLADLSGIVDGVLVASVLAGVMGVVDHPLQSPLDAVANRLVESHALVVIDNCEHLLDASAALAERLLHTCPDVRVIATSREPLAIDGEAVYRVPSLSADEGVQLFAERARLVRPTFVIDEGTFPSVTAICDRLDGLPLAIELAAARCRAMAPAEIAGHLAEHFRLLTAGRRGALARQRTLEASVQWSYDLLDDSERIVLRRLAVFAGGFTLAAAERVTSGDDVGEWHVVDGLTSLVDRSLVQHEDDGERTRYRLLETVRVFAEQRLAEAAEVEATRDRHLAWVAALMSALEADLNGSDGPAARVLILADLDNIRAALDWALETSDADRGLRILAAGDMFWGWKPAEFCRNMVAALAVPGGAARDRARVQIFTAFLTWLTGDPAGSEAMAYAALEVADELDEPVLRARAKAIVATVRALSLDDHAIDLVADAATELDALGDTEFLVIWASHPTLLAQTGELHAAVAAAERLVEVARLIGDPLLVSTPLVMAAFVAVARGNGAAMRTYANDALAALGTLTGTMEESFARICLAIADSAAGDHTAAVSAIDDEVSSARRNTLPVALALAGGYRAVIRWRAGLGIERDAAAEAAALLGVIGSPFGMPLLSALEAEHLLTEDKTAEAKNAAERSVDAARAIVYARCAEPVAVRALARVTLAEGDLTEAEDLAHTVLSMSVERGDESGTSEALDLLAAIAVSTSAHADAARMIGASDAVRAQIGWVRGVPDDAAVDHLVAEIVGALDQDAYEAARAEGQAMSRDAAIAFVQRGRGKRGRPSFGWASLTPTENEVVRLVAEGLANKAIAEKLLMSPATVKTHLTHVYSKLAIASRTELAAQATQRP